MVSGGMKCVKYLLVIFNFFIVVSEIRVSTPILFLYFDRTRLLGEARRPCQHIVPVTADGVWRRRACQPPLAAAVASTAGGGCVLHQ